MSCYILNGNKILVIMKLKAFLIFLILSSILSSCRKEERELIQTPEDEILEANTNIASLIRRTASNDGSLDNIVDKANCFDIAFPYTVNVNGVDITNIIVDPSFLDLLTANYFNAWNGFLISSCQVGR